MSLSIKWEELIHNDASAEITRSSHSLFYYKEELYIFGGGYSSVAVTNEDYDEENEEEEEGEETVEDCNTIYKYNIKNKEWEEVVCTGQAPSPRSGFASVLIDSVYYVFGGLDSLEGWKNDMFTLDLETKEWEKLKISGTIPSPRDKTGCCVVDKNRIVLFGGFGPLVEASEETAAFTWFNSTFLFDVRTNVWSELTTSGDIPTPRAAMGACVIKDSSVDQNPTHLYIVGGRDDSGKRTNSVYSLHLETFVWKLHECCGAVVSPRSFHSIRSLSKTSYFIIFGGLDNEDRLLNDCFALNTNTHEWLNIPFKPSSSSSNDNSEQIQVISGRSNFGITEEVAEDQFLFYVHGGTTNDYATNSDIWKLQFFSQNFVS